MCRRVPLTAGLGPWSLEPDVENAICGSGFMHISERKGASTKRPLPPDIGARDQ